MSSCTLFFGNPSQYDLALETIRPQRLLVGDHYPDGSLVVEFLKEQGALSYRGFHSSLEEFCHSSPEQNLASKNALIRSLAMLDRRVGKRRLQAIDLDAEHEKVRLFHALRCDAEKMAAAR